MAPYLALVTILTGRVHRNTKLGLYDMVPQTFDLKSQPRFATYSVLPAASPSPVPITFFNPDDEYRSDFSTTTRRSRGSINYLDFGMA